MSALRITLRVDFDEDSAVGPGKIALLERMRDHGSLSQAARELKMSYRRAWQLLESLNVSFREPVVRTSIGGAGGGGTTLTPLGDSLIDAYRNLERETTARAARYFEGMLQQVSTSRGKALRRPVTKTARAKARRMRVHGSKRP